MSDEKKGPVTVSKDGKIEITDPVLLDKVAGGAGDPTDDPDSSVNGGCINGSCAAEDLPPS